MPSSLGAYSLELISEGKLGKLLPPSVELKEKYSHSSRFSETPHWPNSVRYSP